MMLRQHHDDFLTTAYLRARTNARAYIEPTRTAQTTMMMISIAPARACAPMRAIASVRRAKARSNRAFAFKTSSDAGEPEDDVSVGIEPCLVGWSDTDEHGIEMYCCEQPGGEIVCKTTGGATHEECRVEDTPEGLKINCNPALSADAGSKMKTK